MSRVSFSPMSFSNQRYSASVLRPPEDTVGKTLA